LDEGFILDKKIGVGQPRSIKDAKVLIANTPMDTDKIKIYGARVRVDSMAKVSPSPCKQSGASRLLQFCIKLCLLLFAAAHGQLLVPRGLPPSASVVLPYFR
jgi:hypothetical protein